ncbi:hypothetical protein [Bdellovibrio sp. KM01]|uniref:GHMP family kinase ATP-binding protein n=1 Tax=Bdellovibrio sp. KM01 TaxID=2748865 RepID=UPI0015EAFD57|nr:hypothetical protein [Bdellovibrio sp. KM01]QLY25300.1 hypothetical protein HW988_18085 [Bdellovibrio sp. KM01]
MVFKSSIPYRIGLIGGGTDLPFFTNKHGTEIINASFKAFSHCEIRKIQSPHIFIETNDYKTQVQIDKLPEMVLISRDEFRISLAVLNNFADLVTSLGGGLHIKTYSEFAPQTGLGGSSAHLIAVLKACLNYMNLNWDDKQILDTAHSIERDTLSIFGGFQDFYPCLYQGAHHLSKNPGSEIIHRTLDGNFLNELDLSFFIMESSAVSLGETDLPELNSLKIQKDLAHQAANAWKQGQHSVFKNLLQESWKAKSQTANLPHVFATKTCGLSKRMNVVAVEKSLEKPFTESSGHAARKIEWH